MRAKAADHVTPLVVDFSDVTFVNTPIWAVLVEYYQHTDDTGAKFAIAGLQERVEASFTIVRLDEFIPHYATVDQAFDALNG
jgi:anti-anti-sigma factor